MQQGLTAGRRRMCPDGKEKVGEREAVFEHAEEKENKGDEGRIERRFPKMS